jgi:hypothetical protein
VAACVVLVIAHVPASSACSEHLVAAPSRGHCPREDGWIPTGVVFARASEHIHVLIDDPFSAAK